MTGDTPGGARTDDPAREGGYRTPTVRPQILYPLFAPVEQLPAVGPKVARLIEKVAGPRVVDLLWHLPTGMIDRRYRPQLADAEPGRHATVHVCVTAHRAPASPRGPHRVIARDGTGELQIVYFRAKGDWLQRTYPVGAEVIVSGMVDVYNGQAQITHPDYVVPAGREGEIPAIEPVYGLTAGLQAGRMVKAAAAAIARAPALAEWLDPALVAREGWPGWREALVNAHTPTDPDRLGPQSPDRRRLAYDELLANQVALLAVRASQRRRPGRILTGTGTLQAKIQAALPYSLTGAQTVALSEIAGDLAAPTKMLRLLQGDVGSGKTVVALLAMAIVVEAGGQAALLAPTEILARQHLETLEPLARAAGIRVALLTGREKGRLRSGILLGLADGSIQIVLGTHAIIQSDVAFRDLALAVVDEQHRFGVEQRLDLAAKGAAVDTLTMTATPIPRTLQLTAYGDMDVSRLAEKPPGRKPVDTRAVALDRLEEVVGAIGRKLDRGEKVYWVCPLVEESEVTDLASATDRYEALAARFGERVGLVHGRLKGPEKDAAMAAFAGGTVDLLVSTTVIEVGVNVPAATVMVIEHAERFGLAQLHQLRGRVGRGDRKASCLLLYSDRLTGVARQRLKIMRQTEDGFVIAEEDLRLRGAGEVLGTRQSGLPETRVADLDRDGDLLAIARDDARLILDRDPGLTSERGQAVRILLYLFERDAAIRYLRSG